MTLRFVFQAKIIGFYVVNEIRYGGARYISTGRSLPTERRHFIRASNGAYEGLFHHLAVSIYVYQKGYKYICFNAIP